VAQPHILDQPDKERIELSKVLSALSNPLRRRVVIELYLDAPRTQRRCVSFGLPVTKATRTHHFKALREAGLTRMEDRGNESPTELRTEELDDRFPGLLASVVRAEFADLGLEWADDAAVSLARYRRALS